MGDPASNLRRYSMRWSGVDGDLAMHEDKAGAWVSFEEASQAIRAAYFWAPSSLRCTSHGSQYYGWLKTDCPMCSPEGKSHV